LFEDRRRNFFCEVHERGSLYWNSTRIMQNIQDVQISIKIVSKQKSLEVLSGVDSEFDAECEMDVNDDKNQEMSMKTCEN
jgi:hypothetical protein